ncbi:MAG: hypothetical protein RJA44_1366 [Pseudomonadota bacterium]
MLGIGLVLIAVCGSAQAAAPELQPFRFAPEQDYGPFVYAEADGSVHGLSVEFLDLIGRKTGLRYLTLPPRPLSRILADVQAGQVDLVTSLRPTPERARYLGFTRPYVAVPAVLVTRAAAARIDPARAAGVRIAVGAGYAVEAHVRQRFPAVQWVALPDDAAALQALQRGEVAAVVADAASIAFLRRRLPLDELHLQGGLAFEYSLSMAYRKELGALGEQLELGLSRITPAERQAILERWIDPVAPSIDDARLLWAQRIGAILLIVGGLLVLVARATRSPGSRDD